MAVQSLSGAQVRAVRAVMRLFRDEDLKRGVSPFDARLCARCCRARPSPGFIHYADAALCNRCATIYELARLCRGATSAAAFAALRRPIRPAAMAAISIHA